MEERGPAGLAVYSHNCGGLARAQLAAVAGAGDGGDPRGDGPAVGKMARVLVATGGEEAGIGAAFAEPTQCLVRRSLLRSLANNAFHPTGRERPRFEPTLRRNGVVATIGRGRTDERRSFGRRNLYG